MRESEGGGVWPPASDFLRRPGVWLLASLTPLALWKSGGGGGKGVLPLRRNKRAADRRPKQESVTRRPLKRRVALPDKRERHAATTKAASRRRKQESVTRHPPKRRIAARSKGASRGDHQSGEPPPETRERVTRHVLGPQPAKSPLFIEEEGERGVLYRGARRRAPGLTGEAPSQARREFVKVGSQRRQASSFRPLVLLTLCPPGDCGFCLKALAGGSPGARGL